MKQPSTAKDFDEEMRGMDEMTNQEILTKAIEKAIAGGWHEGHDFTVVGGHIYDLDNLLADDLIYWHPFAKALWGEESMPLEPGKIAILSDPMIAWQFHLKQMVIADDPIKYLGENL